MFVQIRFDYVVYHFYLILNLYYLPPINDKNVKETAPHAGSFLQQIIEKALIVASTANAPATMMSKRVISKSKKILHHITPSKHLLTSCHLKLYRRMSFLYFQVKLLKISQYYWNNTMTLPLFS